MRRPARPLAEPSLPASSGAPSQSISTLLGGSMCPSNLPFAGTPNSNFFHGLSRPRGSWHIADAMNAASLEYQAASKICPQSHDPADDAEGLQPERQLASAAIAANGFEDRGTSRAEASHRRQAASPFNDDKIDPPVKQFPFVRCDDQMPASGQQTVQAARFKPDCEGISRGVNGRQLVSGKGAGVLPLPSCCEIQDRDGAARDRTWASRDELGRLNAQRSRDARYPRQRKPGFARFDFLKPRNICWRIHARRQLGQREAPCLAQLSHTVFSHGSTTC
jgi:hypothetical protein